MTLLRTALVGLLAIVLGNAAAGATEPIRVEIVEHGIYTLDVDSTVRDDNGINQNVVSNICHVATTTMIPMKPHLTFGFRYRVSGTEPDGDRLVRLTKVVSFPDEVTPPGATRPLRTYKEVFAAPIGIVGYIGYGFDEPWELMRGIWTFQLFRGGRLLAEQNFTVIEDPNAPTPRRDSNSTCFQMSSL